ALAKEKYTKLQAAMVNPTISPAIFKQVLEDFQQTLFTIGTDLYTHSDSEPTALEQPATTPPSSNQDPLINPFLNLDLDEETTTSADYEAID
ncbi:molecular chaperone DnaK, partial [Cronbergia sp. UHCC 0137]|nr:molecular chaperone DnaK [Cronbergia sp. UHCC 0137]